MESYLGYITLYLRDLYDLWIAGGGEGRYASRNSATRSVVFDGSTTLELRNLNLPPNVKYPVDVEFNLRSGATVNDYSFMVHLCQLLQGSEASYVYGNVSFQINTASAEGLFRTTSAGRVAEQAKGYFSLHPNPV